MAPESIGTDLAAISRLRDGHIAALNSGNPDAWADAFTDDGVQMPPNAPANVGKDMVRSWNRGFLTLFQTEFSLSVDEIQVVADWAFERGTYHITLNPRAGGDAIRDVGKYITIYHRQSGGNWGIARDIWNSNTPPPGAG